MYSWKIENIRSALLGVIHSWDDYEHNVGPICDALDAIKDELIAEKKHRRAKRLADAQVIALASIPSGSGG